MSTQLLILVTLLVIEEGSRKELIVYYKTVFRADNVQTKETDGTGLGLYIAKAIVGGHRGKIWFDSIENQGTTFFLELPL